MWRIFSANFQKPRICIRCAISKGHPIEELEAMLLAADPVNGTAPSFDAERSVRKYIGDYALFVSGMYPEAMAPGNRRGPHPSLGELIRHGQRELLHREPVQPV